MFVILFSKKLILRENCCFDEFQKILHNAFPLKVFSKKIMCDNYFAFVSIATNPPYGKIDAIY